MAATLLVLFLDSSTCTEWFLDFDSEEAAVIGGKSVGKSSDWSERHVLLSQAQTL